MALSQRQQQTLATILERSSVDHTFRQQLLADPRRAIQEGFAVVVPPTMTIRFIEKEPGVDALVVLPDFVGGSDELSSADLDKVSGGGGLGWDPFEG